MSQNRRCFFRTYPLSDPVLSPWENALRQRPSTSQREDLEPCWPSLYLSSTFRMTYLGMLNYPFVIVVWIPTPSHNSRTQKEERVAEHSLAIWHITPKEITKNKSQETTEKCCTDVIKQHLKDWHTKKPPKYLFKTITSGDTTSRAIDSVFLSESKEKSN